MIETVDGETAYDGPDFAQAVARLLAGGDTAECFAVAEVGGVYSSDLSNQVENAALTADALAAQLCRMLDSGDRMVIS
jgi:hypothetical protein